MIANNDRITEQSTKDTQQRELNKKLHHHATNLTVLKYVYAVQYI